MTRKHIMALTVGTVLGFKVIATGLVRVLVRTPADRDLLAQDVGRSVRGC